ncbi:hypothetical protein AB9N12_13045 [Bacteroides sp. AN502(2024)]|uniref:hypothetical protein n=1 Tax=Bacteroides sp. AN502(2024) TaxID=3160599 RepID=UPI003516EE33
MKKRFIKKTLWGGATVLTGVVSCTNDSTFQQPIGDSLVELGTEKKLANSDCVAIPLSNENQEYITAAQKLGADIFKHPDLAKEFIKNPTLYFSQYGYKGNVCIEDGLVKLITAYADEQIREAIRNKDLKKLVSLCQSKGLFNDIESAINMPKKIEDILTKEHIDTSIQPYSWFWFAEWVTVALLWAFDITAINFETISATHTEGIVAAETSIDTNNLFNMRLLWDITTGEDSFTYYTSKKEEKIITEIISLLKELRPELFANNSEEAIRNQVKASMHGILL